MEKAMEVSTGEYTGGERSGERGGTPSGKQKSHAFSPVKAPAWPNDGSDEEKAPSWRNDGSVEESAGENVSRFVSSPADPALDPGLPDPALDPDLPDPALDPDAGHHRRAVMRQPHRDRAIRRA